MATIVTRLGKGSTLTFQEVDDNFTNLNTAKLESVSQDTSPELSGNLVVNTYSIVAEGANNLKLVTDTGQTLVESSKLFVGKLDATGTIATPGTGSLVLTTNQGGSGGGVIAISDNNKIQIIPATGYITEVQSSLQVDNQIVIDDTATAGFGILTGGANAGISIRGNAGASNGVLLVDTNGYTSQTMKTYNEYIHVETVTSSGTWAPDAANGPIQYIVLTGNLTINGFSNVSGGQTISILIESTGSETLTLGANVLQAGGDATALTGFDLLTITCVDDETPVYLAAIQSYS